MILTCPECATRYEIDAAKFPAAGRKVRCKKCSHVWFQPGEGGEVEPQPAPEPVVEAPVAPAPEPVEEPVAAAFDTQPQEDEAPPARAYRGTVTADDAIAPPPKKKAARAKSGGWARTLALVFGWVALIGAILIIGWAAKTYRQQIATSWPKSASLFARVGLAVNTRGLDFTDVQHKNQMEDGQPVLVITGKLVNGATHPVAVPHLRVTLSDDARHAIYNWSFSAAAKVAGPGQSVDFRTRLSNPPAAARHVDIRFADNAE